MVVPISIIFGPQIKGTWEHILFKKMGAFQYRLHMVVAKPKNSMHVFQKLTDRIIFNFHDKYMAIMSPNIKVIHNELHLL